MPEHWTPDEIAAYKRAIKRADAQGRARLRKKERWMERFIAKGEKEKLRAEIERGKDAAD